MKTQNRGALAQASSTEQTSTRASDLDALANEIFASLSAESSDDALKEFRLSLIRAADTLARPADVVEGAVHGILRAFPPDQLDALLQYAKGVTRSQIAERQGKTDQTVLKDLASAYAQLRCSLDPAHQSDIESSPATLPSVVRDHN